MTPTMYFILKGGFMMYPLLSSAFIALTIIFERAFSFHKKYRTSHTLKNRIFKHIQNHELPQALDLCKQHLQSPLTSVLCMGLEHFEYPVDQLELLIKNNSELWVSELENGLDIVDTVITAAPLMGLLGTVTGMMSSFQVLSSGGNNLMTQAITGGVAEALIATATGLLIALFCLVSYNLLIAKIKTITQTLEWASSMLIQIRLENENSKKTS